MALDRFKYKQEGERSEPRSFIIFPHYNLLIKHILFLSFHEQTIFYPQVAEQTIYFPKCAKQCFFHKKTIAPPPRNQMVGP